MTSTMRWIPVLLLGCVQVGYGQASLWGSLEAGPYAVGFTAETVYDYTRTNEVGERGRPLKIRWWYPAQSAAESPAMTVEEYARLIAASPDATRKDIAYALRYEISPMAYPELDFADVDRVLDIPVAAQKNAPAMAGRFPLALWSVRYVTALGQSVLSEYLASHGYIVGTVASTELFPRFPYEVQPELEKRRTMNTHVQDLEVALGYMHAKPEVDADRIALMAWSYGGKAAVLAQMRNPDVDAVVSLDATNWWTYDRLNTFVDYDPHRLNVPYLVMHIDREDTRTIFDLIQYADTHQLTFHELKHGTFNIHEDLLPVKTELTPVAPWSLGTETAVLGYETISRYTHHFLNGVLKDEPLGVGTLAKTLALPNNFVTYTQKEGTPAPLSDAALVAAIVRGEEPRVYADSVLTSLASRLLDQVQFKEAKTVLAYALTQFPNVADVHYYLGVAYIRQGDTIRALEAVNQALSFNAEHQDAKTLRGMLGEH